MIEKIQKLKKKKGFTLVELIVVLAIVGVLTAILVPMLGDYVTNAKIAGMDTVAKSIKDSVTIQIQAATAQGRAVKRVASNTIVTIDYVPGTGTTVVAPVAAFKGSTEQGKFQDALEAEITETLLEQRVDLHAFAVILNGACVQVYTSEEINVGTTALLTGDANVATGGTDGTSWKAGKPGQFITGGEIVGTAPKFNV